MSETWLHVIKNAAMQRKEGNYPISPKLLDKEEAQEYLSRVLESADLSTLRQLYDQLARLDPLQLDAVPGLQYLAEDPTALIREIYIKSGLTRNGRTLEDIYNNWI